MNVNGKYIILHVKGMDELGRRIKEVETTQQEYELFNVCADRGAKFVTPWYTIIFKKK